MLLPLAETYLAFPKMSSEGLLISIQNRCSHIRGIVGSTAFLVSLIRKIGVQVYFNMRKLPLNRKGLQLLRVIYVSDTGLLVKASYFALIVLFIYCRCVLSARDPSKVD